MKELSIEEKAKAYDKLLVKLQEAKVDNNVCDDRYCCVIDDIVPELKESGDERIRKEMIDFVKSRGGFKGEWIAWLEKQGLQKQELLTKEKALKNSPFVEQKPNCCDEQKPAEWSEKDEDTLHCIIDALDSLDIRTNTNGEHEDHTEEIYWLKNIKDRVKQGWSEEDRQMRMKVLKYLSTRCNVFEYEEVENWLKSLRPQSHWKPSDEQMEALSYEVDAWDEDSVNGQNLRSLYEQLKKLKDEK